MADNNSTRTSLSIFLSTALHGSVIALIAIGPTYIPGLNGYGDRDSSAVDVSLDDSQATATDLLPAASEPMMSTAPTAQSPVSTPVMPIASKPVAAPKAETIKTSNEVKPAVVAETKSKPTVHKVKNEPKEQVLPEKEVVEESPVVADTQSEEKPEIIEDDFSQEESSDSAAQAKNDEASGQDDIETAAAAKAGSKLAGDDEKSTPQTGSGSDVANTNSEAKPASAAVATQNYVGLKQQPGNQPPVYTREMRLRELQGRGQLMYYVNREGTVTQVKLTKSTGSPELDQAALSAFSKYKFVPGQEGYTQHEFEFSLKGPAQTDAPRLRTTMRK